MSRKVFLYLLLIIRGSLAVGYLTTFPRNKIMALFCSTHRTSILRPPREGNRKGKGRDLWTLCWSKLVYGLGNGTTCAGNGRFSSLDGKLENVCRINLQPRIWKTTIATIIICWIVWQTNPVRYFISVKYCANKKIAWPSPPWSLLLMDFFNLTKPCFCPPSPWVGWSGINESPPYKYSFVNHKSS